MPRICDYEGSHYRTEFWEGQNREYEDRVERIAMQKLLPSQGENLIEIGAGFGRLADLYQGYQQVVLMDYARTQLEEAQRQLGKDDRFLYVVADIYRLPFVDNLFDTLTMVRVMHHLADVPAALIQIQRIVRPGGLVVIEHASKLHIKSLLRWLLRRQRWNPFDPAPVEFVEMNFNFHPIWMQQQFQAAGLRITNIRTLSHYRLNVLKRLLPVSWLVWLDSWAQPTGRWWQFAPSIFMQARAQKPATHPPTAFFRCPACGCDELTHTSVSGSPVPNEAILICTGCQLGWSYKDGIYDFKTPVNR